MDVARNNQRRVVVTGMGAVSCLGKSTNEFWSALKEGRSGIRPMTLVNPEKFPCKVSGEVQNFDPLERIDRREARRMGRFSQFAVSATVEAMNQARLNMATEDATRVAVLIGCGAGGLPETDQQAEIKTKRGPLRMSPFYIPIMLVNMAAANISRVFGTRGYTNTCATACAAGTQAVGEATEVIRRGAADVVITGGTEAGICEIGMGGFATIGALSRWTGESSKASRPFDAGRDGFVPAEGAGILILESLDHALNRNAEPLAEIAGWSATSDGFHLVQPEDSGNGASLAISNALADAGITTEQVSYISAHGTSTPLNDAAETKAIKKAFGVRAAKIPVSSAKSMIGHSLGGSGGLEAVISVSTIRDNMIHPTINQENPDPDCDLDYVPNVARRASVEIVISNSFGFGGQNACIVVKRFHE